MGSTVVLVFECPDFEFELRAGGKIKLGQQLGYVKQLLSIQERPSLTAFVPHRIKVKVEKDNNVGQEEGNQ